MLVVRPRRDRRTLDELLRRGADRRAEVAQRIADRLRRADEARSVAGHRRALREGVEDDDVRPVGHLQSRDGRLLEPELRVRLVGADQEAVAARAFGKLVVERGGRNSTRRVVRVTDPEEGDVVPGVEGVEVREPARAFAQRNGHHRPAAEERPALVDGVSGLGNRNRALLAERDLCEGEDRLLRAERRHDLRRRIDRHAETPVDPAGDRGPQLRQAGGAWIRGHVLDRCEQRLPDERGSDLTRVAHAEVDRLDSASTNLGPPVVETRERILGEVCEDGREMDAHDQTVPRRRRRSCSTSAARTLAS